MATTLTVFKTLAVVAVAIFYWYERGRRTWSAYWLVLLDRGVIVIAPGQGRDETC